MNNDNIFFNVSELRSLGRGAIIGKTVRIRKPDKCSIGRHSIIDDFTYVSCGLVVGDYAHIGAGSVLVGGDANVCIGNFVNIAPGCRLIGASNDFTGGGLAGPAVPSEYAAPTVIGDIKIEDHVLLGTNTVVLPGVHLPEGVATGAMTLVPSGMVLSPWTLYVGTPARALRKRDPSLILEAASRLRE